MGIKNSCFTYKIWTLKRYLVWIKREGFLFWICKVLIFRVATEFLHEQEQVTLVIVMKMDVGSCFCIWRCLNALQVQTTRMALNLCEYTLPKRPLSCKLGLENLPIWHIQPTSSFITVQLVIRKYNFHPLRKMKSNNAFELMHENTFFLVKIIRNLIFRLFKTSSLRVKH